MIYQGRIVNHPGRTLTPGDFLRMLKKLNRRMGVFCELDNERPAQLFFIDQQGEYQEICAIPKNYVPEYSIMDGDHIIKRGWRAILGVVLGRKLCTPQQVERTFKCQLR